jgi:hypothetical protein
MLRLNDKVIEYIYRFNRCTDRRLSAKLLKEIHSIEAEFDTMKEEHVADHEAEDKSD